MVGFGVGWLVLSLSTFGGTSSWGEDWFDLSVRTFAGAGTEEVDVLLGADFETTVRSRTTGSSLLESKSSASDVSDDFSVAYDFVLKEA